jgi:hypothetical protein
LSIVRAVTRTAILRRVRPHPDPSPQWRGDKSVRVEKVKKAVLVVRETDRLAPVRVVKGKSAHAARGIDRLVRAHVGKGKTVRAVREIDRLAPVRVVKVKKAVRVVREIDRLAPVHAVKVKKAVRVVREIDRLVRVHVGKVKTVRAVREIDRLVRVRVVKGKRANVVVLETVRAAKEIDRLAHVLAVKVRKANVVTLKIVRDVTVKDKKIVRVGKIIVIIQKVVEKNVLIHPDLAAARVGKEELCLIHHVRVVRTTVAIKTAVVRRVVRIANHAMPVVRKAARAVTINPMAASLA